MSALAVGYARCFTDHRTSPSKVTPCSAWAFRLSAATSTMAGPAPTSSGPDRAETLAAPRSGDTFVVTKLDRLARSLPGARAIVDELTTRQVSFSLGWSVCNAPMPSDGCCSTCSPWSPSLSRT